MVMHPSRRTARPDPVQFKPCGECSIYLSLLREFHYGNIHQHFAAATSSVQAAIFRLSSYWMAAANMAARL